MSVPLPAFRRVRLTQQCVIHPQDKGGNYLPCASEDWVLFVSLAADEEKIILRTEHRCLPIEPGSALLLPPNVCHELPFVQAPCLMLEFSAADDGQAMFEFPQLQGTPAWTLLQLLYSEQTTAAAFRCAADADGAYGAWLRAVCAGCRVFACNRGIAAFEPVLCR